MKVEGELFRKKKETSGEGRDKRGNGGEYDQSNVIHV
jgi:hypothetical protein